VAVEIRRVRAGITNTFVLRERGTVVVDPGGPSGGRAALRRILTFLGTPPRLDLVLITHGHFDHRAAADMLRAATGAPVAVHQADVHLLVAGRPIWPGGVTRWGRVLRRALGPVVGAMRARSLEPDVLVDDEGIDLWAYGVSGRVVHTPGHTRGSVSVVLTSGDAFVGDLAMNRLPLCLRPSLGLFAEDPLELRASWQRLIDLGVRMVYPAHGRPFPASALSTPPSP